MIRRLAVSVVALAAALAPLAANATITPDSGFGTGGTATVPVDCTASDIDSTTPLGSQAQGRFYLVEQCPAGYYRVIALAQNGTIDTAWGRNGRLTLKFPTACAGTVELHPAQPNVDGSVYMATSRALVNGDLHVCLARITRNGKAWFDFGKTPGGATTPIRRLDRTGGINTYAGFAVDHDLINVFTARLGRNGVSSAAFVNRYHDTGRPDTNFSGDGQVSYRQPHQVDAVWGGVYVRRATIAIAVNDGRGLSGTQFVRFNYDGSIDRAFGGDGSVFVSDKALGGARFTGDQAAMDPNGRIVIATLHDSPGDGNHWIDLVRLKGGGTQDTAFNAATRKITTLPGNHFGRVALQLTAHHYVIGWDAGIGGRTTGYDSTGARWTALGPNGTAPVAGDLWLPDALVFYDVTFTKHPLTSVSVTRSTVS